MEAVKADIMAVRETDNTINNSRPVYTTHRSDGLVLEQPTFDRKVEDKYQELSNFEIG